PTTASTGARRAGMGSWPTVPTAANLAAQFIADFPVFDTSTVVPTPGTNPVQIDPSSILYWSNVALLMLNQQRWTADGDPNETVYTLGLEMFVAHNVILEVLAQRDMDVGGVPGVATGVIAGKSAGDVSISYMPGATVDPANPSWQYTIYGQRFCNLFKLIGAGPMQIGVGCPGDEAGAWAGPGWPWL